MSRLVITITIDDFNEDTNSPHDLRDTVGKVMAEDFGFDCKVTHKLTWIKDNDNGQD